MQSWIFSIITLVFTVILSFRNHSDMLICCLRSIYFFYHECRKSCAASHLSLIQFFSVLWWMETVLFNNKNDISLFFLNVATLYYSASISHSFLLSLSISRPPSPISLSITPTNSSWKGLALVQNPNDHPSQKCQWMEIRQRHQTEDWSVALWASEELRLCAERGGSGPLTNPAQSEAWWRV